MAFLTSSFYVSGEVFLYKDTSSNTSQNFIFKVTPGGVLNDKFEIVNSSDSNLNLNLQALNPIVTEAGTITPDLDNRGSLIEISLDSKNVSIKPRQKTSIGFTAKVPENLESGEYLTYIYAKPQENTKTRAQIGSNISKTLKLFFQVDEDFELDSSIINLNILDPKDTTFQEDMNKLSYAGKQNLIVAIQAENLGNVFARLEGDYRLIQGNNEVANEKVSFDLIPRSGARTFYISTNLPYVVGENRVQLNYTIVPQNIEVKEVKSLNISGELSDSVRLNQNDLLSFPERDQLAVQTEQQRIEQLSLNIDRQEQTRLVEVEDSNNYWYYVLLVIVILAITTGSIFLVLHKYWFSQKSKKKIK
ncbi:MAG: hypothetical protein AAGF07_04175 [Patescibacteria group bacterium]